MPLTSFGAVLDFAEYLERADTAFYQAAAGRGDVGERAALYADFAKSAGKRTKAVERVRREFVSEMILEPIVGLTREPFVAEVGDAAGLDAVALAAAATMLETRARDFYQAAASKLGGLPEVARELKKLGKKRDEQLARLA